MLNEVLRLTQGDLTNVIDKAKRKQEDEAERERNNEAFYKGYKGEVHE